MTRLAIAGVLAMCATAAAQQRPPDVQCKKTETQAECHDRLKCKPDEELEDCQKRLLKGNGGQQGGQQQGNGGQQQPNGSQRDNRGTRDGGDRGDRGDNNRSERDRGDEGSSSRGGDRGGRDDSDGRGGGGSRRRAAGGGGSSSFQANKTFGLGLELGEPTGLNGKYFVAPAGALDFGVGYIYDHYYYGDGIHIYADYLWHPTSLASTPSFELPFYVGVGARFWDFHYCYLGVCDYGGSAIGVRVPIGIAIDFNNAPIDIFVQLVPVLDFLGGDYYTRNGDRAHFGVDASLGIRIWFK